VKERVFFVKEDGQFVPPPKPEMGYFKSRLSPTLKELEKYLPETVPLSRQQFVDTFRGRKKNIYQAAADSLIIQELNDRDAHIKVFVKCEKTDRTSKADPVPRVISPRNPRYNVEVGRFLRRIEEPIFQALGEMFGDKTVMKGLNAADTANLLRTKWEHFSDPVAVGLDASRFDQHVSKEALQFEHSVYDRCFEFLRHRRNLRRLLKMQLINKCEGYCPDGKLKYVVDGGRMSGDMNTSLGNCVLMCCMIKQYLREREVQGLLANNGDDCVVFMEKKDLPAFSNGLREWFLKMGFNMTVEQPCHQFEQIEFCQTKMVRVEEGYVACRNPITAIAKDCVMLQPYNMELHKKWMHMVGVGGLAMAGGIPIFQDFYNWMMRNGSATKKKFSQELVTWGRRMQIKDMKRKYMTISDETRVSFYEAWGITPDEQEVAEQFYRTEAPYSDSLGSWVPRMDLP